MRGMKGRGVVGRMVVQMLKRRRPCPDSRMDRVVLVVVVVIGRRRRWNLRGRHVTRSVVGGVNVRELRRRRMRS